VISTFDFLNGMGEEEGKDRTKTFQEEWTEGGQVVPHKRKGGEGLEHSIKGKGGAANDLINKTK